jgi:hypothetical protein
VNHVLVLPGLLAVIDNVIPRPLTYHDDARALPYGDVEAGSDTFHGIASCADPTLPDLLMRILPAGALPTLSFFRRAPPARWNPTTCTATG